MQLAICCNGTRRARWHTRLGISLLSVILGFQRSPCFSIGLSKIVNEGGQIPCIDIIVDRVYPIRYFEILSSGNKRFLTVEENDKAHESWTKQYEEKYQILLKEKLKGNDINYSSDSVTTVQKDLIAELEVPFYFLNIDS